MKITLDELNVLLMHSSDVEEIEKNSPLKIMFYPHTIYLDTATLKVVICSEIYRRGNAPRYNRQENILFFANEVHMRMSLQSWGLAENALNEFIEELTIAEEIEEIVEETALEKFAVATFPKEQFVALITLLFITLIQKRVRKSKFPLYAPLGTLCPSGVFFLKPFCHPARSEGSHWIGCQRDSSHLFGMTKGFLYFPYSLLPF